MPYKPLVSKIRVHNPNKKGSIVANRNYITYIATREGVALDKINSIDDLLNTEGSMQINIREDIVHQEAGNKEYLEYMARRPRSHGLFGNIDTEDLSEVASKVADLTKSGKVIYRGIISLCSEDAEALGFKNAEAWYNYMRRVMPDIAAELGISSYDHTWVAAFHAEDTHPHVHYELWDNRDKVKSPYIHVSVQKKCRDILSREMFSNEYEQSIKKVYEEELSQLKDKRNIQRKSIITDTEKYLNVLFVPGVEYEKLPSKITGEEMERFTGEINKLINVLPGHGSMKYQYLPEEAKIQLNHLTDILCERPDFKAGINDYLESVKRMHSYYGETHTEIEKAQSAAFQDIKKRINNKVLTYIKNNNLLMQFNPEKATMKEKGHEKSWNIKKDDYEKRKDHKYDNEEKDYKCAEKKHYHIEYLERSAAQENDYAQYKLGSIYVDEDLSVYDLAKRIEYLEKSAAQENDYAQYKLGSIYVDEDLSVYDLAKGMEYLERSAAQENGYAQYKLGSIYVDEDLSVYDLTKGIEYLKKSAEQGNEYAQYRLGSLYVDEELPVYELAKGMEYLDQSAAQGNEYAQYRLGSLYVDAKLPVYDLTKGIENLEKSAAQENGYAQYKLGSVYVDAELPVYDLTKGIEYLEKSAVQENEHAQYRLGSLYVDKELPVYDLVKGMEYLEHAAAQENEYAQYRLGSLYVNEKLPVYDLVKGMKYLEQSAVRGNEYAQCNLGNIYFLGKNGVKENKKVGRYWLEKSAEQGNEYANNILNANNGIGINVTYELVKGALQTIEAERRRAYYMDYAASHTQSKQAMKEAYIHEKKQMEEQY